jgi:Domain of unknown function (DUF4175)
VPPPDHVGGAQPLIDRLQAVSRRLWLRELLRALSAATPAGVVAGVVLLRMGAPGSGAMAVGVLTAIAASLLWMSRSRDRWSRRAAARAIESAHGSSRNVVITAEELSRHPDRARPWIRTHVFDRASDLVRDVRPATALPLGRDIAIFVVVAVVSSALVFAFSNPTPSRAHDTTAGIALGGSPRSGGSLSIVATITPPVYTGLTPRTLANPERIDAVQGSALRLSIEGGGAWRVRFMNDRLTGETLTLTRSGYLAIEPEGDERGRARRLVPVTVTPDRVPTIRIDAPGKDLLLPDAKAVIGVRTSATDDFGLESLELRYTTSSGSGEQFEFKEGSIPLKIAKNDARNWQASVEVALARLGLGPGDAIIYHAVGRDGRPGDAGVATSDTYFIEVAGPGQVALAGFELPPDRERYALSQQMIVLKLERLRAREQSLDRPTLELEMANLAAEQRAVRANFIFLMGGHVEDEEQEASHSDEIQEGRLENTARKEIVTAIQHMGRAEQGMATVSTNAALPPARAAVEALQRAFARNRYFLRTLPVRSRIDPSRRLTGELSGTADWDRSLTPIPADHSTQVARDLLARLLNMGPADFNVMAEEALTVDPSSENWRTISKSLLALRDASKRTRGERDELMNRTVALLTAEVQRSSVPIRSPLNINDESRALQRAWTEGRRR